MRRYLTFPNHLNDACFFLFFGFEKESAIVPFLAGKRVFVGV
jgi:hypothetical protein